MRKLLHLDLDHKSCVCVWRGEVMIEACCNGPPKDGAETSYPEEGYSQHLPEMPPHSSSE
jgi:hypothetical protein